MTATALPPMHPGEFLREDILPGLDITKTDLADRLRISRQTLYDLLGERQPVTANLALRLSRLLGNEPRFWLTLQANYDIATVGASMAGEIEQISPLVAA